MLEERELCLEVAESAIVGLYGDEVFLDLERLDGGLLKVFDFPVELEEGFKFLGDAPKRSHTLVEGLRLGLGSLKGLLKQAAELLVFLEPHSRIRHSCAYYLTNNSPVELGLI